MNDFRKQSAKVEALLGKARRGEDLCGHGCSDQELAQALAAAARRGSEEQARRLMRLCEVGAVSDALREAALYGKIGCAKVLLEAADPRWNDCVALKVAAGHGRLEILKMLLRAGADARALDCYALRGAAGAGHLDCVKLLLPLSDPMAMGSHALTWAATCGHADCVKFLLPASDAAGGEALRAASANGHVDCVALLLPHSDPLAPDSRSGLNAADLAKSKGHGEAAAMIEAFVRAGVEAREISQAGAPLAPSPKKRL